MPRGLTAPKIVQLPFDANTHAFCTYCRKVKPRDSFARNKNRFNGLNCWCKECTRECTLRYESDPTRYRLRRDRQALSVRRAEARKFGKPISDAPVKPLTVARGIYAKYARPKRIS